MFNIPAANPRRERDEFFRVDDSAAVLERHVTPERGRPYVHRVCHHDLVALGHAMDELSVQGGFTVELLAEHAFGLNKSGRCVGMTLASVVLAFAREHGHVETVALRRSVVAGDRCCLDLVGEFTGFNHRIYSGDATPLAAG